MPAGEVRRLRDDPAGFDRDYWPRGAELGWTSLLVAEAHGGGSISDAGLVDLTLVADEFGRRAAPGPLVPTNVVAATLSDVDGDAAVGGARRPPRRRVGRHVVRRRARAERRASATSTLDVRVDGDDVVLRGVKRPVESADQADHLLVTGRTGDGLTQVLVPRDAPGVSITPMQHGRPHPAVLRRDLRRRAAAGRAPSSARSARPTTQVERQLQHALVLANAESVGAMQAGFDMTVEWAFDRYSFGRPLASYQALKHRFADMKTLARGQPRHRDEAAGAVAAGAPDAGELVSAAKAYIGEYGSELLQDCVQMHGGIGVTFEHDLHLFLRRHTVDRALYGTPSRAPPAPHRPRRGAQRTPA